MGASAMHGSALELSTLAEPKAAKAVFISMTFPTDLAPLELMLPHQLRMVTREANTSLDVVVVDNRPLAVPVSPQDPYLRSLEQPGSIVQKVVPVDYVRDLDDPKFLGRFYAFPEAQEPEKMTVRKVTGQFSDHEETNLMGMLTAMGQCLDADPSVEICLYMDPDIFVYRSPHSRGLLDLAPGVFEENPDLFVLMPPLLCEHTHVAEDAKGVCQQGPPLFELSQRHIIFHRARLAAALPFRVTFDMLVGRFAGIFENVLTRETFERNVGSMMCGSETVVTHPSVNDPPGYLTDKEHFAELAKFGPEKPIVPGFDATYTRGLEVFLDRWEAGEFKTERSLREVQGSGTYTASCLAMRPEKARIDAGLAF